MNEVKTLASMYVCDGCCCGRVEKGHNEVPISKLKTAWKKKHLNDKIRLTISNCLGHCSMHNVTLLKIGKKKTWIGKISTEDHYTALIEWAHDVAKYGNEARLPNILVPYCFIPNETL